VTVDVTCASWLEVQQTGTACSKQFWSQVYTLMQRVRTAEECGVLAQLEVFLHLFLLRELLDAVRIEFAPDDRCGTSPGTLDSPRSDTQSLEQSSCTPLDSLPPHPACSFFCRFLVWAYGEVEARTRYNQLQRLANWFRVSTDVEFFRRLCNGSITPQHKPHAAATANDKAAATAAVSQETNKLRQPRLCPLSITYFYLLSPRLPDLQCRFGDGVTPEMEARLISYLSVRPLVLFQQRLATDFGLAKRGSTQMPSPTFGSAPQSAMSVLTDVALDANGDAKVEGSLEHESIAEALLESMAKESAEDKAVHARLDAESEDDSMQSESDDEEEASPVPSDSAREASTSRVAAVPRALREDKRTTSRTSRSAAKVEPAAPAAAAATQARPASAKKRKLESSSAASSRGVVGFDSPPADQQLPAVPCVTKPHALPLEIVKLGVKAWLSRRQLPSEQASHRAALDNALVDLMWGFAENDLTDGERLAIPEFKRARRSAARDVAARRSGSMSGERACNLLLNVLDMLITRQPQSEL
jgi:hypothetical protein